MAIDDLRPEIQESVRALDVAASVSTSRKYWQGVRAELLRLADENARLNKIESLATEQRLQMEDVELYLMDVSQPDDEDAHWCDRMKSAIELLVQDCNYAVGQKNKAEAELAALRKRVDDAPTGTLLVNYSHGQPISANVAADDGEALAAIDRRSVRLLVDDA